MQCAYGCTTLNELQPIKLSIFQSSNNNIWQPLWVNEDSNYTNISTGSDKSKNNKKITSSYQWVIFSCSVFSQERMNAGTDSLIISIITQHHSNKQTDNFSISLLQQLYKPWKGALAETIPLRIQLLFIYLPAASFKVVPLYVSAY